MAHFLLIGRFTGISCTPLFDAQYYASQLGGSQLAEEQLLHHFLSTGYRTARCPHPLLSELETDARGRFDWIDTLIHRPRHCLTGLFDETYYRARYPDLDNYPNAGINHYLDRGWQEQRQPSECFDPAEYSRRVIGLMRLEGDPLTHYMRYGQYLDITEKLGPIGRLTEAQLETKKLTLDTPSMPVPSILLSDQWIASVLPGKVIPEDPHAPLILVVAHHVSRQRFGAERSFIDLLSMLAGRGTCRLLACLPAVDNEYIAAIQPFCERIIIASYHWLDHAEPAPRQAAIERFSCLLNTLSPDLVLANTSVVDEPLVAARQLGIPRLSVVREVYQQDPDLTRALGSDVEQLLGRIGSINSALIANSTVCARQFPADRLAITVNNPVDHRLFQLPIPEHTKHFRVGLLCSGIRKKGVEDFFHLARLLGRTGSAVECELYAPMTDTVQHCLSTHGHCVWYRGYVDDPYQALAGLDVVVSLSHFDESFGRTVAEALAAGRPAIVYDRGFPAQMVRQADAGLICPAGDVESVARAVLSLLAAPGERRRLGANGRHYAEQHLHPGPIAQKLERVVLQWAKTHDDTTI